MMSTGTKYRTKSTRSVSTSSRNRLERSYGYYTCTLHASNISLYNARSWPCSRTNMPLCIIIQANICVHDAERVEIVWIVWRINISSWYAARWVFASYHKYATHFRIVFDCSTTCHVILCVVSNSSNIWHVIQCIVFKYRAAYTNLWCAVRYRPYKW